MKFIIKCEYLPSFYEISLDVLINAAALLTSSYSGVFLCFHVEKIQLDSHLLTATSSAVLLRASPVCCDSCLLRSKMLLNYEVFS